MVLLRSASGCPVLLYFSRYCTVIQVYASISNTEEAEVERFYENLHPKKDVLFIIGDWNAKVGSQETVGIQANLALEYGMKQGKD